MKLLTKEKNAYFAASNTSMGFVSYFDRIFGELDTLYIIKGGSGTGKSKLMREVAFAAEKKGLEVEYFYCSLDPSSLDGIIIPSMSLGFVDGTFPHVVEPTYPGAVEHTIDLSQFWNPDLLKKRRKDIVAISAEKKRIFAIAMDYLAIAGSLENQIHQITVPAVDFGKLQTLAEQLTSSLPAGNGHHEIIRNFQGIGAGGQVELDISKGHNEIFVIESFCGAEYVLLDNIRRIGVKKGYKSKVSFCPLLPAKANVVCLGGMAFVISDNIQSREVDVKSVVNTGIFDNQKATIDRLSEYKNSMLNHAVEGFQLAMDVHFALEEIYIDAMDFTQKEEFTRLLVEGLF